MKIYFKKSALFFIMFFLWLSTNAYSNTYQSSHVAFVNTLKDSLVIVKYPNGNMPNTTSDFVFTEKQSISAPLLIGPNDMIGLFRFIDIGIPMPSAINDYNKASFLRIFAQQTWNDNTHIESPEAYSFYKLGNFSTDRKTLLFVEPNMAIRRGKPELAIKFGQGYSIIPIAKPSEIIRK